MLEFKLDHVSKTGLQWIVLSSEQFELFATEAFGYFNNGAYQPAAIASANILLLCYVVKFLTNLIWWPRTRTFENFRSTAFIWAAVI